MRPVLVLALILSASPALANPVVITGFASPESVLVAGDHVYVANVGAKLDPLGKDGDGFISRLAPDGTVQEMHAFPGDGSVLDAPKGMALVGATLYVADIDRVVGFDTATGSRSFEAALPPGPQAFANDIAADGDGTLLVTDTLRNAVFRLDPATGSWTQLTDAVPGANGIAVDPDNGTIAVAGIGAGFTGGDVFTLGADGRPTMLTGGPHGLLDGIAFRPDGSLLVSDWVSIDPPAAGRIVDGRGAVTASGDDLRGPADFALGPDGRLWVPSMPGNSVVILPPQG